MGRKSSKQGKKVRKPDLPVVIKKKRRNVSTYAVYLRSMSAEFRLRGVDMGGRGTFMKLVSRSWPVVRERGGGIDYIKNSTDLIFEEFYPDYVTGVVVVEGQTGVIGDVDKFSEYLGIYHGGFEWWLGREHFPDIINSRHWVDKSYIRISDSEGNYRDIRNRDEFMRVVSNLIEFDRNNDRVRSSLVGFSFDEVIVNEDKGLQVGYLVEGWNFSGQRYEGDRGFVQPGDGDVAVEKDEPKVGLSQGDIEGIKEKARVGTIIEALREDLKSGLITKGEYLEMLVKIR